MPLGVWLIPARAELPGIRSDSRPPSGAHPCVHGVAQVHEGERNTFVGLSLRARGFLGKQLVHSSSVGLIPACAGLPAWFLTIVSAIWAHPCVRGASVIGEAGYASSAGSSLRARGFHGSHAR